VLRADTDNTRRPLRSRRMRMTVSASAVVSVMLPPERSMARRSSTANGVTSSLATMRTLRLVSGSAPLPCR
jgi:hypothetical protein